VRLAASRFGWQLERLWFRRCAGIQPGCFDADGVDIGFKYSLKPTPIGRFRVTFDSTYLHQYDVDIPGAPQHVANTFIRQLEPIRAGTASPPSLENWGVDALITERYIGSFRIEDADAVIPACASSTATRSIQTGTRYTLALTNTRVGIGIDNVTDHTPPILFQNT